MDDAEKKTQLDPLLARWVDQRATPQEMAELEQLLDGDGEAQARYIEYCDLHHELRHRGTRSTWDTSSSIAGAQKALSRTRSRVIWAASTAAVLLLAVGMVAGHAMKSRVTSPPEFEVASETEERTDDGVAVLVHAVDANWIGENRPQTGSILSPGELNLGGGLAQIEFYSGARVIVEGPANLEVISAKRVVCRSGKVRAFVPPQARGFSIVAPRFELVDLGTEFGLEVAADGESSVQVFDGEVEIFPHDAKRSGQVAQRLQRGNRLDWDANGTKTARGADPSSYPSFENVRARSISAEENRFAKWQRWNQQLQEDPRVLAQFDFESDGSSLLDRGPTASHGAIVGCEWSSGRWPAKRALEFKRPGDRVRINVPGEFDSLSLTAWIRVDAKPNRRQSLLLTDGYEIGRVHWQIGSQGELRLGTRVPIGGGGSGYGSNPLFVPRRIGTWSFVGTVYDGEAGEVRHYLDGDELSAHSIVAEQKLKIGLGDIGNWSVPVSGRGSPIRNFSGRIDELTIWSVALDSDDIENAFLNTRP